MVRILALLLCLVFGVLPRAAYAAYTVPATAPRLVVPNYNVEIAVAAIQTAIGHGIAVLERSGNGEWTLCHFCMPSPEYPLMDSAVAQAGGVGPYIESKRAALNEVLARRFPAIGGEPTGTTLDRVNQTLATNVLRLANGVPAFGPR